MHLTLYNNCPCNGLSCFEMALRLTMTASGLVRMLYLQRWACIWKILTDVTILFSHQVKLMQSYT
jgi:hypothetical protein